MNLNRILLVIIIISCLKVSGQDVYGLDPLLYNGKVYAYHAPAGTAGTPFMVTPEDASGAVQLRGERFEDLSLKYDLFNQHLVLQYANQEGGAMNIIMSDAWMSSFDIGDAHFELMAVSDTLKQIFQVIGHGPMRIAYAWSKDLELNTRMNARNFVFSKPEKKSYLLQDNQLLFYKNNKTFIRLLGVKWQKKAREYLSQHHIKVSKASDQVIAGMMDDLNTLINE